MTRQKNIETIRKACIAANPEIGSTVVKCICGHQFNCHAKHNVSAADIERRRSSLYSESKCSHCICLEWHEDFVRPIHLADVLLAIENQKEVTVLIDSLGCFMTVMPGEQPVFVSALKAQWNLRKDTLTDQSDETLEFIANLLK